MREAEVIARLRRMAGSEAARGLLDDVALLGGYVLTHDTIAEGVHFLPTDPPASVGWKLVAVNLSDLAAKGATPAGALLSLSLGGDPAWTSAFIDGIEAACESYALPLLGGDTIALPAAAPGVHGMTAIGSAGPAVPARAGMRPGDRLWLVGTLGDSAAGLALLQEAPRTASPLIDIYHRPVPLLAAGQALAPHAHAMMDVSDGLLIDSARMGEASGCGLRIDLAALPLSRAFIAERGQDRSARIFAATGGDDYALLAALPPDIDPVTLSLPSGTTVAEIGVALAEPGLVLADGPESVALPERLGHEHRSRSAPPVADRA